MMENIRLTFIIAFIYTAIGCLSFLLTSSIAYPTLIWPGAGIALGAVMVFGNRALLGILFGSVMVNYGLYINDIALPHTYAINVAVDAFIQGWLGNAILKLGLMDKSVSVF